MAVPDLHLGTAAQVDAAVGLGDRLVFEVQLEIAVVLFGGEEEPMAIVDQFVVLDAPVGVDIAHRRGPELRQLLGAGLEERPRILAGMTEPAGQVAAVEESGEAGRRGRFASGAREDQRQTNRQRTGSFMDGCWSGGGWRQPEGAARGALSRPTSSRNCGRVHGRPHRTTVG